MEEKMVQHANQALGQVNLTQLQVAANSAITTALQATGGSMSELSAAASTLSAQQERAMSALETLWIQYQTPSDSSVIAGDGEVLMNEALDEETESQLDVQLAAALSEENQRLEEFRNNPLAPSFN